MSGHQRTIRVERRSEQRPVRPKAWNHQDELKTLERKAITISFLNGDKRTFTLLGADPFTLRVYDTDEQSTLTYFKQGLLSYSEVKQ